jgi:hypothetical protein
MTGLRSLTLITSPDVPSTFAAGLLVLTRLRQLALLRVGLGFGAVDALRRLHACVARALPSCQFEMLSDVDGVLDEAGELGGGGLTFGDDAKEEDEVGPAASGSAAAAARARGPRFVRLMRTSWGG